MKSIKEKQLLVKWSKAMNEPIDPAIVQEVESYERLQQEIIESVRVNSINDLTEASRVADNIVTKIVEYPKPPTLEEVLEVLKEETDELVQSQTQQAIETSEPTPTESPKTLADIAADHITKEVELEEKADSFQQPDPTLVSKNLDSIVKKLRFLEQAIGKIAATGPGSGEVRLLRLDDVDTRNLGNNKALFYNEANAKLEFRTISGGTEGSSSESANLISVTTAIIPDQDSTYDIGTPEKRWGTLYLANNTIDLGGAIISSDGSGTIIISSSGAVLPVNSKIDTGTEEKPIALLGSTGAVTNLVPFYTKSQGLNTIATNFTFGANPDDYVFTNFTFNDGSTITQSSRAQFYF
jgi:hypothetical protein